MKKYESPKITELGSVAELTGGNPGTGSADFIQITQNGQVYGGYIGTS